MPLDVETVAASVRKTHRLLVADEGWGAFGVGAELAQAMNELAYDDLDGPVARLHSDPQPHPLAPALERAMLVDTPKLVAAIRSVIAGEAPVPRHWRALGGRAAAPAAAASPPPSALPPQAKSTAAGTTAPPAAAGDGEPITMPFGDLTVSEGRLVRWLKAAGDVVSAGEIVAEIETDKAVVEIEAPVAGTLGPLEQEAGAVVPMGGRIGSVRAGRA